MPFDETITKNKIQEISDKLQIDQQTDSDLRKVSQNLNNLLDHHVRQDNNEVIITPPTDDGTGKAMTNARRDKVYDEMILKADELLA